MGIEEVGIDTPRTLDQIAQSIATARKILVVTGAGISTSCGIPDFRSKEGLYSLIAHDYASQATPTTAIKHIRGRDLFDVNVWNSEETTEVFLKFTAGLRGRTRLADTKPSAAHRFLQLIRDQRRLLRVYTQNIDGFEQRVGLRTDLSAGAGNRSRFGRKALDLPAVPALNVQGGPLHGGCEAVQLHGDLESLRCSVCQKTVPWEEGDAGQALQAGTAPNCPSCAEHDQLRRIAGRRGTRVGVLRPNVVLYGEEHPSADLIGPMVTADIASGPDLLLIFGTSLKVHGLQQIVKQFANAVHARPRGAGKVVFINKTPPPGSVWKNVIDYWVRMDCDSFVQHARAARPGAFARQTPIRYPIASSQQPCLAKSTLPKLSVGINRNADPVSTLKTPKAICRGPKCQSESATKRKRAALADISQPAKRVRPSSNALHKHDNGADTIHCASIDIKAQSASELHRSVVNACAGANIATDHGTGSPIVRKRRADAFAIYEDESITLTAATPDAGFRTLHAVVVPSARLDADGSREGSGVKRRKAGSVYS